MEKSGLRRTPLAAWAAVIAPAVYRGAPDPRAAPACRHAIEIVPDCYFAHPVRIASIVAVHESPKCP